MTVNDINVVKLLWIDTLKWHVMVHFRTGCFVVTVIMSNNDILIIIYFCTVGTAHIL